MEASCEMNLESSPFDPHRNSKYFLEILAKILNTKCEKKNCLLSLGTREKWRIHQIRSGAEGSVQVMNQKLNDGSCLFEQVNGCAFGAADQIIQLSIL